MPPRKLRIKTGTSYADVPQDRDEASGSVAQIGQASRELARIEADMNDQMAKIKEQFELAAAPHRERIAVLTKAVQAWAEAHREELTDHGKRKTHDLPAGQILWRMRPPSVRINGVDAVLDLLRRLGLDRFIRRKEEVNRDAILAEPDAVSHVPGIAISQAEDFVVVPFETTLSEAA